MKRSDFFNCIIVYNQFIIVSLQNKLELNKLKYWKKFI